MSKYPLQLFYRALLLLYSMWPSCPSVWLKTNSGGIQIELNRIGRSKHPPEKESVPDGEQEKLHTTITATLWVLIHITDKKVQLDKIPAPESPSGIWIQHLEQTKMSKCPTRVNFIRGEGQSQIAKHVTSRVPLRTNTKLPFGIYCKLNAQLRGLQAFMQTVFARVAKGQHSCFLPWSLLATRVSISCFNAYARVASVPCTELFYLFGFQFIEILWARIQCLVVPSWRDYRHWGGLRVLF